MPWKSTKISEQFYYYYDSENNKPILFDIHGFGVTAETHLKHASFPLEDHFRLIIPEIPGHGELMNLEIKNIQNISNYLLNLINHVSPRNFNITGRSIGGVIVLDLLSRSSLVNRINHIYIIETPLLSYDKSFTKIFRIFESIAKRVLINNLTHVFKKLRLNYYDGLKIFLEKTRNKEILKALKTLKDIEINKKLISHITFIYCLNDLYLTNKNIDYLKNLKMNVHINPMVGHFKNSTDKSVSNLIISELDRK